MARGCGVHILSTHSRPRSFTWNTSAGVAGQLAVSTDVVLSLTFPGLAAEGKISPVTSVPRRKALCSADFLLYTDFLLAGLNRKLNMEKNLHSALQKSSAILCCCIANCAWAGSVDSSSSINSPPDSFWTQKYLLGYWGGLRTRLEPMGVTFYSEYRDDFQGNVTGTDKNGNDRGHSVNFGRFRLNLDVDLMKLTCIDGEFFFSAAWHYGGKLLCRYLNVHTLTSQIAGPNSQRIDQLWYQQGFFY